MMSLSLSGHLLKTVKMTQISEIWDHIGPSTQHSDIQQTSAPWLQSQHVPNNHVFKQQREKSHLFLSFKVEKGTLCNECTAQGPQQHLALPLPFTPDQSATFVQSLTVSSCAEQMKCLSNPLASFDLGSVGTQSPPLPTCSFFSPMVTKQSTLLLLLLQVQACCVSANHHCANIPTPVNSSNRSQYWFSP